MATRCPRVRTYNTPSDNAGVAISVSPIGFSARTSNSAPAFTTKTLPSSLEKYTLPSLATGEAVNAVPAPRRSW